MKPKLSVVILDFLKSKRVVESVGSIRAQTTDFTTEIVIADNSCNAANAAKLREVEHLPAVRLIFNEKNIGYTRGVNAAARQAVGEYFLILNPDIVLRAPDTLQKLVDFMDQNPHVAIAGPRQIDEPTGTPALTVRAFPRVWVQIARRTWLRRLPFIRDVVAYDEMRHLDYTRTQPVDWLQSSCVIVRRDFWEAVGGLDERYFLFMSDPEICWQAWARDFEVVYVAETTVYADGIRASAGGFTDFFRRWTMRQHLADSLLFRLKHFGRRNPRLVLARQKELGQYA